MRGTAGGRSGNGHCDGHLCQSRGAPQAGGLDKVSSSLIFLEVLFRKSLRFLTTECLENLSNSFSFR